jgi:hypothetical protein
MQVCILKCISRTSIGIIMIQALCTNWKRNILVIMIHELIMIFFSCNQTSNGSQPVSIKLLHLGKHFRIQIYCPFSTLMSNLELHKYLEYSGFRMTLIQMPLIFMMNQVYILSGFYPPNCKKGRKIYMDILLMHNIQSMLLYHFIQRISSNYSMNL